MWYRLFSFILSFSLRTFLLYFLRFPFALPGFVSFFSVYYTCPSHFLHISISALLFFIYAIFLVFLTPLFYISYSFLKRSRDSVVGIVTGYGLDDRGVGVRVPVVPRIFSSPHRPDLFWDPANLLSDVYRGSFPGGKAARA
jgi:hypothetical protein